MRNKQKPIDASSTRIAKPMNSSMPAKKKKHGLSKPRRDKRAPWKLGLESMSRVGRRIGELLGHATEQIETLFRSIAEGVGSVFSILSSILVPKSLRKKVEDIGTSKQAQQFGSQVGEFTDTVERKFTKAAINVFEILRFLALFLIPRFIREPVLRARKATTKGISRFVRRLSNGLEKWAERCLPTWLVHLVQRVSKAVGRSIRYTTRFVGAWWKTRNLKTLGWSIPAILMTVPLAGFLTLSAVNTNGDKIRHYRRATFEADQDGDTKTADLYRQKLKQLGYLKLESAEYLAALSIANKGEEFYREAFDRMKTIAPLTALDRDASPADSAVIADATHDDAAEEENYGHLGAHIWIVRALMTGMISLGSEEEDWKEIERHVSVGLKIDPKGISARYYKLQVDQRAGRNVIAQMVELAREYPQFSADLMSHHQRARQLPEARSYARRYLRYIGELQQKASELTAVQYANWSQAEQLMGNDKEALRIAHDGFENFPDEPILQNLAGAALLRDLASMDPNSPEVLPTLKAAHIADKGNLEIAKRLASKLVYDESDVRPVINELKEENRCAPEVFLLAGDLHAGGGRWTKAKSMYAEAIEVDDNCSKGRNNVAWILANIPPVRLTEALEWINTAIQTDGNGQYYETRGQIYVKMGRWKEAEKDLQRALNGFLPEDDLLRAHASLAEVYEKLEQPERAAAHRDRAGHLAAGI